MQTVEKSSHRCELYKNIGGKNMNGHHNFYKCERCGNMVGLISVLGAPLVCCGQEMTLLVPNTVEASTEKHLPAVTVSGNNVNVQVGSVLHPMEDGHKITFVFMETECGGQRKSLKIGAEPKLSFCLADDKPIAVYAYCNLHGLWKTDV